jgi:predicted nicotinamide N-methyase
MSMPIADLGADLERRFRTKTTTIPAMGSPITLLQPASADDLISEADFVKDERLPYWADVWPSSVVLAKALAARPGHGASLLELGCGSGVVASQAARSGYAVTATDYYADALEFARWNAWVNADTQIDVREVDWRRMPNDLGPFDMVVASDVLYEPVYGLLVARAIRFTLKKGGVALIADPGRLAAPKFVTECQELALDVRQVDRVPFVDGPIKQTIDLYEVRR